MANFSKSFNFRGGFQVDTDTLIVRGENVGIGSSIPTERLDVDGVVKAKGLIVDSTESFFIETATVGLLSATEVRSGIFTGSESTGVATYYGDGRFLQGLPTSQWLDIDVGLGYTSIYAAGNVGVDTNDPRFTFQVGGTPFGSPVGIGTTLGEQDGVTLHKGNIAASGIISTRGEFVGMGSNITFIDGSNITVGQIGSMAYGPLIVTEEVIADRFTGIASTALGVPLDADLVFNSATADRFEATGKFISTEGYVQVGLDQESIDRGDVEVIKDTNFASIYSISENSIAEVFVGKERPGSNRRQFGGLRSGIFGNDPQTQANDLDLVNYDVGNVNTYLHSGSGGTNATIGKFRWIYGQTDTLLAEIDRFGKLTLLENPLQADFALEVQGSASISQNLTVAGIATFSDVEITGDLTLNTELQIGDIATDNLTINGTLDIGGNILTPTSVAFNFVQSFTVASGADFGGTVTATDFQGDLLAGTVQFTDNLLGPSGFSVDPSGNLRVNDITANGTVSFTGGVSQSDLTVTNSINGPGLFAVDSNGAITGSSIAVSDVNTDNIAATSSNLGQISGSSLTIGSDATINGNATVIGDVNAGSVFADNLTITGALSLPPTFNLTGISDVDATQVNCQNLDATNAEINNLTIDTINAISGNEITLGDIGTKVITDELDISEMTCDNQAEINELTLTEPYLKFGATSNFFIGIDYDTSDPDDLVIRVYDSSGDNIKRVVLNLDNVP